MTACSSSVPSSATMVSDALALLVLAEPDDARALGHDRRALGRAGLEQLDDAGQTVRDVLTGDAAGVEGPHGELRAGLADGLGGDDADRLALVDELARRQHHAVARRAHAAERVAREHRTHPHPVDLRVGGEREHLELADLGVARHLRAVGQLHVVDELTAEQLGLEDPDALGVVVHVLDPDATRALAVVLADDDFLRDVDETTREVPGVGGAQRGVGETLARTVGGDEVLEDREALAEVRLDRARDDLTTGVRHQTTHTGDLLDLHHVAASTRAHHHVDRVELVLAHLGLHRVTDACGGLAPDLDLLLAPLVVGDDAAVVLALDLVGLRLEVLEETGLGRRRPHVGDGDGETGTGRELEAEVLELVEALGHDRTRVALHQLAGELGEVALLDRVVVEREVGRERLVEEEPPEGALDEHARVTVACRCAAARSRRGAPRRARGTGPRGSARRAYAP